MITPCRPCENPFSVQRIDAIDYRLSDTTWAEVYSRLRDLDYRAAVVGPHGTGKTTFLDSLGNLLETHGLETRHVFINSDCRGPQRPIRRELGVCRRPDTILVIDGAEQLGRWAWWRTKRSSREFAGLVISTHTQGRLPTLLHTSTTIALLRSLVEDLAPDQAAELDPLLPGLFDRFDGNIRLCLLQLFDLFAGREDL